MDPSPSSGLASCRLEVQVEGESTWTELSQECTGTDYVYDQAEPRTDYTFRLTAIDNADNDAWTEETARVSIVTKYYYFGGKRVAMRGPDDAVVWLHGDHLGSTSLATSAGPNPEVISRQLYYPFGQTRWTSEEAMPTDFGFTGQRNQSTIGLYDYHARFYDPYLNRWIQPDTIVPQLNNPQSLNRYSYVHNNPLRFIDPSGHHPLDKDWEKDFFDNVGRWPTDLDRQNRLFSLIFPGRGKGGTWTDEDWAELAANRDALFAGRQKWSFEDEDLGLSRFVHHTERLASYYGWNEADQFVRAFGLLFAGIPYSKPLHEAVWDSRNGPAVQDGNGRRSWLREGTEGWDPHYINSGQDQTHHYAGNFWLGYFYGPAVGYGTSFARDIGNMDWADIMVGNIAVSHAFVISSTSLRIPFTGIGLFGAPYRHRLLSVFMEVDLAP